ncbi:MFS transporter [Paenibacillus sp. MMS20-IR301]|uniref:MFS transporter n=1 Tax=Paenibacillus sp. MMS20-IR301 TaxID=2895946 RepID=UPI0028E7B80B|nr:MFS transporter [Paenibacillus sp. MMS20-IR301]WNS42929.1 MFS transporter [Paenibacillus sp. MMS20-IR301]
MRIQLSRKLNSRVWNILAGTLFTRTALFMSVPYLAIFLTHEKHLSLFLAGCVLSINPLVNVAFSSFGGALADRLPLHRIIAVVPVVWGIVFILFYYADSFPVFLLLNGLNGLCYSIFEPASKKVLSSETLPENRLLVFNLRYAAINLGCFAGPLLSLLFNMKLTLFPYVILGMLYILYGASTIFFFRHAGRITSAAPSRSIRSFKELGAIRKDYVFLLLLAGMSFSFFGYSQLNGTVSQYLAGTSALADGTRIYSIILSANAAIILAAQFAVLRWISRWNPFNVVLASNLLIAASFLFFVLPVSPVMPLLFITVFSLGELLIGARFDTLVDELASDNNKGLYFGCSELVKIGTTFGPVLGSGLLGLYGADSPLPVFGLIGCITAAGAGFIGTARSKHLRRGRQAADCNGNDKDKEAHPEGA